MAKEIYLAGKIDLGETSIDAFASDLEDRGHTVLEKWWTKGRLPTPYLEHVDTSAPAAQAMIDAAFRSDVFILFPEENILGAAVEFGAAVASTRVNADKLVFVVNPHETRQSVFYAHPDVIAIDGITRIKDQDWY